MIKRVIPSTGEALPVIGLGTWQTFDIAAASVPPKLTEVLQTMRQAGATLIDSSPMYGNAETVVGALTSKMEEPGNFFYATKVWTTGREAGIRQMTDSFQKMRRETMDLMQVHNLTDWKTHLTTLRDWKEAGKIRYIGITHYTDSMHGELERILSTERVDFVQFNYSLFSRHAEKRLLSAAAGNGVATLINRPFGTGNDLRSVRHLPLPPWAAEYGFNTWSQLLLAYIIAHPAVTCVIPATGNPAHARENFQAGNFEQDGETFRRRMISYLNS